MKKYIIKGFLLTGCLLTLAGCDENAWNDKLDGFEGNLPITDVKTIEYTLSDADYASIASNSDNKSLAGSDASALTAVGTQHYFTELIPASKYVPAFLSSTAFPYFTLSDGSAVKLTYNIAVDMPEIIGQLAAADKYTVTTDDYMSVWGSEDNFINGFAPSKQASKFIPTLLSSNFVEAAAGDYVVVTYQVSEQEPIFGNVGGEENNYTHVAASTIVSGSKYVIVADGNAATTVAENKSYGYLGLVEVEEDGKGLNLPEGNDVAEFTFVSSDGGYNIIDSYGRYMYQSGTYNSFNFAAECPAEGAVWAVEAQGDGSVKILNTAVNKFIQYDAAYGSYGSYSDERGVKPSLYVRNAAPAKAPVADVPLTTAFSVWGYNGKSWSEPKDVALLQPADYTAMGQSYPNLSNNGPAELLPTYLKTKYPYAAAEDSKYVMYQYYANNVTSYRCDQYIYDGAQWIKYNGVETETSQFVKSHGKWNYDPSVTVTLPAGKGQALSTTYYQACVDWVYENVDKPLGSTDIKSGKYYVTSYGNNEYYSGTSAYQGNVDVRPSAAKQQYPEGYEGMSDEFIVELMMQRFAYQVMPGALSKLHADAVPVDGIEVLYTINFTVYTGSSADYTVVYKITAPAKFELVSCTWWEQGLPADPIDLKQYMK